MPSSKSFTDDKHSSLSLSIPLMSDQTHDQNSSLGSHDIEIESGPSRVTQHQKRPTFNHSTTSYSTRPPSSSSSQQRDDLPSKESSASYPPVNEPSPYSYNNLDSPPDEYYVYATHPHPHAHTRGGRHRSVSLSLNEMWDKSRSVCSLRGEGGVGKSMILGWVVTTLLVLGVLGCYRRELFVALDSLSQYLSSQGYYGHLIFFVLIFITTIPPIPLYSTLIVLSGYTFGVWTGFVISYAASLVGAVLVFAVSRWKLRDVIGRCLSCSPTSSTLLSLLSSHPHLLLLIRIAPYPYNLLNVILASSPSLSLRTYTACTALSLCKLVLHTWIGAGIHNLSEAYGHVHDHDHPHPLRPPYPDFDEDGEDDRWPSHEKIHHHHPGSHEGYDDDGREDIKMYSTWIGIFLCVVLFFYLTYLTKKTIRKAQREQEEQDREMRESGLRGGLLSEEV
ncbi:hypothetical protein I302_101242 [Kwoniella bestiolae CBS 10118]|uniref:Golgi apparatus membrane protein TVP38 n=1 Tax=Kwoniella bestiolae CBS 10118 TaxID=1296100 RepID=A0A1B9G7E1_9TREE|nr:hypothetical protein I302_04614 [Kwoniella bestiolae CBS 10118]OCF26923.1 hypothetical protein I302_04614 [Kwoniella bestiolae CBS 10118]